MNADSSMAPLAQEIRGLYTADPQNARQRIEMLLKEHLAARPDLNPRAFLQNVANYFRQSNDPLPMFTDHQVLTRAFGLILGRKVSLADLSSTELLQRLAESLNTIFDALNQLISSINMSFNSTNTSGEQTIRQFIGFHLEGGDQTKSLEDYLGQINQAFLTTQEAFKSAARAKVAQILETLDTEKIAAERSGGLKIGPLRKAEDFDILADKIDRIRRWFDSGRFMEDFLREFESNCQTFINR